MQPHVCCAACCAAQAKMEEILQEMGIDLIVLARYMQVGADTCLGAHGACPCWPAPSLAGWPLA